MAEPPKDLQKELERELSELEERVDRLRALYEQYFMGYEKLEPSVPRKDVDRRFAQLRKTQIRNTAQRYRFNVVTQKFNTYAMYWTRVCRQIEEGTFKRHVQRAAKRFGPGGRRDARDDYSIDVELGDFEENFDSEDFDMDAVLADANAAADAHVTNLEGGDTIPPQAMPQSRRGGGQRAIPAAPSSTTSFAMTGSRESLDADDDEQTPPAGMTAPHHPARTARPAALPAGAKARVLVRRRGGETEAPPSARSMAAAADHSGGAATDRPSAPSSDQKPPPSPAMRPPMQSTPDRLPPPSTSVIRASPTTMEGRVRPAIRPAQGSSPQLSSAAGSVNRVPINAPSPPGQGHIATPASPMLPSSAKMPVAAPNNANPRLPQSANRLPVPPNAGAPRTPMSPMSPVRVPAAKPQPPPPPSTRTPASGPTSTTMPDTRSPSMPSIVPGANGPDSDAPRTSRRPPPALPSQHSKKK